MSRMQGFDTHPGGMSEAEEYGRRLGLMHIDSYLQAHNWEKRVYNEKAHIYSSPCDEGGHRLEVILPNDPKYIDFEERVSDAMRLIGVVEGKETDQVIRDICMAKR